MSKDKYQALYDFWSSFGLPAYNENTVPDDAVMPYITYSVAVGRIDVGINISASLWYRSTSWEEISKKADEVAHRIGDYGHVSLPIDGGFMYLTQGSPFIQTLYDETDDSVRRIYINVMAEFLTAY